MGMNKQDILQKCQLVLTMNESLLGLTCTEMGDCFSVQSSLCPLETCTALGASFALHSVLIVLKTREQSIE